MELWFPEAVPAPGNILATGHSALGGYRAPKRGAVLHSAEGRNWHVIHELLITKSWHFTIGYDKIEQHHPIDVNCWHAGDTDDDGAVRANIDLVGIEALGVAGEPLTEYQINAEVRLNRWLAEQFGRYRFRRFDGFDPDEPGLWLLAEHNEVSNTYTACPSGRIPWGTIIARLEELDLATAAELQAQINQLKLENRLQQGALDKQKLEIEQLKLESFLQQAWLNIHQANAGKHEV